MWPRTQMCLRLERIITVCSVVSLVSSLLALDQEGMNNSFELCQFTFKMVYKFVYGSSYMCVHTYIRGQPQILFLRVVHLVI